MAYISEETKLRALEVARDKGITKVGELAEAVGVSRQALTYGRRSDDVFRTTMDAILAANKGKPPEPIPDFLEWRERFMGYHVRGEWLRATTYDVHRQAYEAIKASNRLVMLIPPFHMKTYIWSIEYSTWLIMRDRNVRIMVVQKSQTEAKKIIRAVQERLTSHDFYQRIGIPMEEDPITLYGGPDGFKPDKYGGQGKWSQTEFTVSGVTSGEKDPTMQAFGATSGILSIRADHIIIDDPQAPAQRTPEVTNFLAEDLIQQSIVTRIDENQSLTILGSRLGSGDVFERILTEEWAEDWPVVKFPAVLDFTEKKTLLPEMWDFDKLMRKRKEVGEHTWATSYMQQEGDAATAVFRRSTLTGSCDRDLILGNPESFGPLCTHYYIGHDPAIVNYNVIIVWGLDKRTKRRYLVDIQRHRGLGSWDAALELLEAVADKWHPHRTVIEVNNTQGHVADGARRVLGQKGYTVVEYKTSTGVGQQAHEQDFSISSIGALFESGMVTLPYGDQASRNKVDDYIDELCRWYTTEDGRSVKKLTRDQVMATLFAESEARREMLSGTSKPKDKRRTRSFARRDNMFGRYGNRRPHGPR